MYVLSYSTSHCSCGVNLHQLGSISELRCVQSCFFRAREARAIFVANNIIPRTVVLYVRREYSTGRLREHVEREVRTEKKSLSSPSPSSPPSSPSSSFQSSKISRSVLSYNFTGKAKVQEEKSRPTEF
jgi:hypothetical protein